MNSFRYMKLLKYFALAAGIGWVLTGCAAATYRVSSTPAEADVEVTYRNGLKKSLGKTPVSSTAQEVNPQKEPLYLVVRKPGYETLSVFVPTAFYEKSVDLNIMLNQDLRTQDSKKIDQSMGQIASMVAEVQKDIQKKDFPAAEQKLARLLNDFPNIAVLYSLMGNVYYLERKLDSALTYYKKALDLDPASVDLNRIIEKIQGMKSGGTQ